MADRGRVAVVGSLHYDIMVQAPYLPRTGETLMGDAWWWKPGGKGGNQAMAAASHGASASLIGCLGSDQFGARLRERLAAAHVDIGGVRTVLQGSGMSVAIQQDGGDYAAVVVSGANRDIDASQVVDSGATIGASDVLLLQNEIGESANLAAAELAREAGATVVLNAAPARPMGRLEGLVDVLIVNAVEAEMLGAAPIVALVHAEAAARSLAALAPTVVVTAGSEGVAALVSGVPLGLPAHAVERAETHGAGDVFAGAFAARLAAADGVAVAMRYANAAAALHVSTPADERDGLTPDDVARFLSDSA